MTNQIQNPKIHQSEVRPPTRGFTLIELLVVISIIGMLSSVVMVSLQSAREKGRIGAALKFATYNYRAFGADALLIYNFDETGNDQFKDSSGNNLNLTANGSCLNTAPYCRDSISPVHNQSGGYFSSLNPYSGTNAFFVQDLSSKNLNLDGNFTISFWIRNNGNNVWQEIINSNAIRLTLYVSGGNRDLQLRNGCNVTDDSFRNIIVTNKWQHISVIYGNIPSVGNGYSIYLDGRFIKSKSCNRSLIGNLSLIILGAVGTTGGNVFQGDFDDVHIYKQSLTASEVWNLYAQSAPKYGVAVVE